MRSRKNPTMFYNNFVVVVSNRPFSIIFFQSTFLNPILVLNTLYFLRRYDFDQYLLLLIAKRQAISVFSQDNVNTSCWNVELEVLYFAWFHNVIYDIITKGCKCWTQYKSSMVHGWPWHFMINNYHQAYTHKLWQKASVIVNKTLALFRNNPLEQEIIMLSVCNRLKNHKVYVIIAQSKDEKMHVLRFAFDNYLSNASKLIEHAFVPINTQPDTIDFFRQRDG